MMDINSNDDRRVAERLTLTADLIRFLTLHGVIVMPRLPLVCEEEMTLEQRSQFDRFPSNLTRGLLLMEGRLARSIPNLANALRTSGLDSKVREGAILRVAALSGSAFERMQHLGEAKKAGWTELEIAAIEAGDPQGTLGSFAVVLTFIDECVASPRVSDPTFAAVLQILAPRDIASLLLLIGHYMMVARFIATIDIELDAQPSTWETDH